MNCMKCGRALEDDEIALHRKLINRGAKEFMCLDCLAAYYATTVERLRDMIRRFRADGCTLFL